MENAPFARAAVIAVISLLVSAGCNRKPPVDGEGIAVEDLPEITADIFKPMDGGIELTTDEIKGRNTWNLWTGGNQQFWERMSRESHGLIDPLKTIDSRKRPVRFKEIGLINQPGYKQATQPDEFGLWIDEAVEPESDAIDPKVYGRSTGIMGFRLFRNPDFDEAAAAKWDGERFYNDPDYAVDPNLIRPYKVGISCGVCHIAFDPLRPPKDPENPEWENLRSAIGNQYLREGPTFAANVREGGLFWEMLKAQPPGTSDTSRIATDNINNPNSINPIFLLGERLAVSHREKVSGETMLMPEVEANQLAPMVLKDGADSVGVPGATMRVYVNIGMYSQHWLQQHNALIGLGDQKPFSIKVAQENSTYWRATETKFANVAKFFARLEPLPLADAPGGSDYMRNDMEVLRQGKLVFAENCATCHSSKRPPEGVNERAWFAKAVLEEDFLKNNFLGDEVRHKVTKIGTNANRTLGTNAMAGHIWANFSSDDYKALPSVGEIDVYNPYTDKMEKFKMPSGGPGYYRTASLVALWTSAPFLHNNSLGKYTGDPSVAGRMEAFNDAVEKLLWPEKRLGKESIWRTSRECDIQIQAAALPSPLDKLLKPHVDDDGYFRLGPIPEGTPINLLANLDPESDPAGFARIVIKIKKALLEIKLKGLDSDEARKLLKDDVAPALFAASKSPDLINDRGHTFGEELSDADKLALIEYLKTF